MAGAPAGLTCMVLPYRSIDLRFETVNADYFQESAVVNYPNDFDYTRIAEFKHIHSESRVSKGVTVILREYPSRYEKDKNIPFYPFFNGNSRKEFDKYKELARGFKNIILMGRLAEYRYYDMDDAVERALESFVNNIKP